MMDMNEPMETKKHQETHATKIDDCVTSPILVSKKQLTSKKSIIAVE